MTACRFYCSLLLLTANAVAMAAGLSLENIAALRLQGELSQALANAERLLHSCELDEPSRFALHLELARIHDRIGLHDETRPVAAALENIRQAEALASGLGPSAAADVQLALADYFYRAEMSERIFERAIGHAEAAIEAFVRLEDRHGQADAVHRLGLIHLQRRELMTAGLRFQESLLLDQQAGERTFFRGEYERHMGFVLSLQGDNEAALPYFERSLHFRIEAGAIDASMFAAITLASALIELGRADEAGPHIEYAERLAKKMDSRLGLARVARLRELPTASL